MIYYTAEFYGGLSITRLFIRSYRDLLSTICLPHSSSFQYQTLSPNQTPMELVHNQSESLEIDETSVESV